MAHVHAQSHLGGKDYDTRVIDFVHLEMINLKQTELQRVKNRGKKG